MHLYETHTYTRFRETILSWNTEQSADIYALVLLYQSCWSADSQGREIAFEDAISLGYNTRSYYNTLVERIERERTRTVGKWLPDEKRITYFQREATPAEIEISCLEAKWLPGSWIESQVTSVPHIPDWGMEPDRAELDLRAAWCASLGIPRSTAFGGQDPTGRPLYESSKAVAELCGRVALALHQNGVIIARFGRTIPITIQTDDHSEDALAATSAGNPPGVADEYLDWYTNRR